MIAFIGGAPAPNGERAPARVTKRDIARAFGVKGEAKAELKLLIKDLQAEGAVAHGRKALTVQGRLPSLVVADIAETRPRRRTDREARRMDRRDAGAAHSSSAAQRANATARRPRASARGF